jgi:putative isomerase
MERYKEIKAEIAKGWNTWNTRSVLSYVLMPEGFSINLGIKEYKQGNYLKEALIGRFGEQDEKIHPGAHAYDGSYTELNLKWKGMEFIIQTATENDDLVVLVTPLVTQMHPATLIIESGMLWNRKGTLSFDENKLIALLPKRSIEVYTTKNLIFEANVAVQTPYLAVSIEETVGISTGVRRSLVEIKEIIDRNKEILNNKRDGFGELSEVYNAMQSCMAWDTIYEPQKDRVVTTVSRLWNINNGGYALFCWDTYFAAYMAALDNKQLAYSNAIEITKEKTDDAFIPNVAWGTGYKSYDRSQPPVGSMVVKEIFRKYREKWFIEYLFEDLYKWNTWFLNNREVKEGLLAWGSNPYTPKFDGYWETAGVNDTFGGALESGLDNSPMYDDIPFDKERHMMKLADVGLTGLYIMDCRALSEIAVVIGRGEEAMELKYRAEKFELGLESLWDSTFSLFLNKRTDSGDFSQRISPTNFYSLFSSRITNVQAEEMLKKHFYNSSEFWGDWIMPSIARNDTAYSDQDYWRGRIWAPMNFLVYLGLRNQGLAAAQKDMAEKSMKLLLKEWVENGHVHENYNGDTGEGCDKRNSDKFYHWGALLSLIGLIEANYIESPEKPLSILD